MKKIFRSFALSLLGGLFLVSCGETSSAEKNPTSGSAAPQTSQKSDTSDSYIKMKKKSVLVKGVNQTVDLKDCFEFGGKYSIDNVSLSIADDDAKYVKLEGTKVTGLVCGKVSVYCKFNAGNLNYIEGTVSLSSISVYVVNPSDVANSFHSDDTGDYKMTLVTTKDNKFTLERPEGTCSKMQDGTITKATITGTYSLEDDGYLHFTVDSTSSSLAMNFTMSNQYGYEDGKEEENNDYFLFGKVPVSKDTLSVREIPFIVTK